MAAKGSGQSNNDFDRVSCSCLSVSLMTTGLSTQTEASFSLTLARGGHLEKGGFRRPFWLIIQTCKLKFCKHLSDLDIFPLTPTPLAKTLRVGI